MLHGRGKLNLLGRMCALDLVFELRKCYIFATYDFCGYYNSCKSTQGACNLEEQPSESNIITKINRKYRHQQSKRGFAQWLKCKIDHLNITRKQFAKVSGFSAETIRRWESGISIPRSDHWLQCLKTIASISKTSMRDVVDDGIKVFGHHIQEVTWTDVHFLINHCTVKHYGSPHHCSEMPWYVQHVGIVALTEGAYQGRLYAAGECIKNMEISVHGPFESGPDAKDLNYRLPPGLEINEYDITIIKKGENNEIEPD